MVEFTHLEVGLHMWQSVTFLSSYPHIFRHICSLKVPFTYLEGTLHIWRHLTPLEFLGEHFSLHEDAWHCDPFLGECPNFKTRIYGGFVEHIERGRSKWDTKYFSPPLHRFLGCTTLEVENLSVVHIC
jgi:hypothetical protein